ncbi:MAG: hypothetical protein JWQ63_3847 [Mucilaginibacter sp.]|nr:hypothetical protein [Mucilaginibacter sp.]
MKKLSLLILFIILLSSKGFSQTIPVGDYAENIARMNQLLGISDDLSSFTQHPLNSAFNSKGDSAIQSLVASKNLVPKFKLFGIPSSVKVLPFTWLNDYNSKLPFGYNNGPLYPNVGYQTMITGGIFIKAGILNIQFKPELVHAENSPFLTFANVQANYKSGLIPSFFYIVNGIDAPERFGPYGLSYAGLGQSKITLIYKNVEVGVSTENMWWGPGVQNSIMMSNSAPGFLHWTFNSSNPVKTIIGSFEWQLIGGRLEQSGFLPYDPGHLVYDPGYYIPKPRVTRYISAFTANWHPKWLDGLFLGVSGYDYMNKDAVYENKSFLGKLIPLFKFSSTSLNSINNATQGDGQDFAYAVNIRQVLEKYNAEIYFEFARNDLAASFTDFLLEPEHSGAYTVGGSKIFTLHRDQYIKFTMELTHLQIPDTFLVSSEPSWYSHDVNPRDGYTNLGRMVGAGIGPGSNSLMLDISYIRNMSSFGMKVERYVHDNDLYYLGNAGTTNFVSNWVDVSDTFYARIKLRKFLVSAEYTPIYTYNYEYLQGNDVKNKHARISLTYYFD